MRVLSGLWRQKLKLSTVLHGGGVDRSQCDAEKALPQVCVPKPLNEASFFYSLLPELVSLMVLLILAFAYPAPLKQDNLRDSSHQAVLRIWRERKLRNNMEEGCGTKWPLQWAYRFFLCFWKTSLLGRAACIPSPILDPYHLVSVAFTHPSFLFQ